MVCAILRKAPSRAYFEFAHQPEMNVEYTLILDTHRKYRTPNVMNIDGEEWGKIVHSMSVKTMDIRGAR